MSTDTGLELLERAARGDTIATTVLLAQIHARLERHIARRIPRDLNSTLDADDILQSAKIDVYRGVCGVHFQGDDAFYRWCALIALRKLRNAIRAARTLRRGGLRNRQPFDAPTGTGSLCVLLDLIGANDHTPSRTAAGHEAILALEDAMLQLPEHYLNAVRLVYLEGRSPVEAGVILGRTPRAIHNLCHKAKALLRSRLGSRSRFFSRR